MVFTHLDFFYIDGKGGRVKVIFDHQGEQHDTSENRI